MNLSPESRDVIKSAESEDLPISFHWVQIFVIVYSAALQTKAASLWSESRMLRKINHRKPEDIIQAISATTFEKAFCELYVSLSKGRHTLHSRSVKSLYSVFGVAVDIIFGWYSVEFYSSDAIAALVILVSLGSWTVLGARRLTLLEISLLCFFAGLYCTSMVLFGSDILAVSDEVRRAFYILRIAVFSLMAVSNFWYLLRHRGYNELPDIVEAIAAEKLGSRRGKRERFERMKKYSTLEKFEDLLKSCPYWPPSATDWMKIGARVFIYSTNAVVWGSYPAIWLPRVVVIEVLEFIATVLFFINDTQVEPALFMRLMQLAQCKVTV